MYQRIFPAPVTAILLSALAYLSLPQDELDTDAAAASVYTDGRKRLCHKSAQMVA